MSMFTPDDDCGSRKSWRDVLRDDPLWLVAAYRLYDNTVCQHLGDKLGIANIYILSAGWGLIRADFLTQYYNITFSASARGRP